MHWRGAVALAASIACSSCTPSRPVRRPGAAAAVAAPADTRLLHRLALDVPIDATTVFSPPVRPLAAAAPPFVAAGASDDDERRAADCLSAAVYYEARSEPIDGQRAVAQVVLNRVRDRAFPASVCRVVYQRSAGGCQFSFACDGSMNRAIEPRAWAVAEAVARAALSGSVYAPVGSATHYHTAAVFPWWASSLARIAKIGSHIFYRWGDRLGGALSYRQVYSGHETVQIAAGPSTKPGDDDAAYAATIEEVGVTVHRGIQPVSRPATTGHDPLDQARTRPVATAMFGVRIHRGSEAQPETAEMPGVVPG